MPDMPDYAKKQADEINRQKKSLDDLERELFSEPPSFFSQNKEGLEKTNLEELKEMQAGLGEKNKLFSPEIEGSPSEENEGENSENERARRTILLRIREILASGERNRSERLNALLSQAPKGMEGMIGDLISKYSPVMNELAPPIKGPDKVDIQTTTIFAGYKEEPEKKSDPYSQGSSESGLYSGGARPPDYAEVRFGVDTSAEAAVRKMMGKPAEEPEKTQSGYQTV